VPTVAGARCERLSRVVRDEQRDAAGPGVRVGGAEAVAELVLGRHVRNGVVDEDRVERPPQPQRAHVAEDVLAVGVERPAQGEHLR